MFGQLFVQECERCWRTHQAARTKKRQGHRLIVPKPTIKKVVTALECGAVKREQPVSFVVSAFAFYYADIERSPSFRYVNLKLQNFWESVPFDSFPKFTDDDCVLAIDLRETWNDMMNTKTRDYPFRIRSVIAKAGVNVGKNTFFTRSVNIIIFTKIAHWINKQRLLYPEISGLREFFLALPVAIPSRRDDIAPSRYLNFDKALDIYYKRAYDKGTKPEDRYARVLEVARGSDLDSYRRSTMFCRDRLLADLELE